MKIQLTRSIATDYGAFRKGAIAEVSETFGNSLIKANQAKDITNYAKSNGRHKAQGNKGKSTQEKSGNKDGGRKSAKTRQRSSKR